MDSETEVKKREEIHPVAIMPTMLVQPEGDNKQPPTKIVKKPAEILCNCPQKCHSRVPQEIRLGLYKEFSQLGDHYRQNQYLQSYIEMRSVYKRLWCEEERVGGRLQRRVSCKYKIPVEVPKEMNSQEHESKIHTNAKGKTTFVVKIKDDIKTIEVCQKAFMNVYGITEKRIRLQREKLIAKLRNDSKEHKLFAEPNQDKMTNPLVEQLPAPVQQHEPVNDELSIVESFFRNQLWRPEYIGLPPSEKLKNLNVFHTNIKA